MKKGLGMYNVKSYLLKNKYTSLLIFFNRLRMFRFFFKKYQDLDIFAKSYDLILVE